MSKATFGALFFIVLLGGGVVLFSSLVDRTKENVPTFGTIELNIPITLEVEGIEYALLVAPGSSVYEAMVQTQETSGFAFLGREFADIGFFVEEINGKRQNPRAGKYWIYSVNGQKAEVGISTYIVNKHDIISWKYEDEE